MGQYLPCKVTVPKQRNIGCCVNSKIQVVKSLVASSQQMRLISLDDLTVHGSLIGKCWYGLKFLLVPSASVKQTALWSTQGMQGGMAAALHVFHSCSCGPTKARQWSEEPRQPSPWESACPKPITGERLSNFPVPEPIQILNRRFLFWSALQTKGDFVQRTYCWSALDLMVLVKHLQGKCISPRSSLWRGHPCRTKLHLWLLKIN